MSIVLLMAKYHTFYKHFLFQILFPLTQTLISLTQARMGIGRVTFPSKGPIRGQNIFLMAQSQIFICFIHSILRSEDSASYFLRMIILISLVGTPWLKPYNSLIHTGWLMILHVVSY